MSDANLARALCLACNYPLRGLETPRCPECGRAFDPQDPQTFNDGPPIGPLARWFLKPCGWPTIILGLCLAGILFWLTPWPRTWSVSAAEYQHYRRGLEFHRFDWLAWFMSMQAPERVFLPTITCYAVLAPYWSLRSAGLAVVIMIRRPAKSLRGRHAVRQSAMLLTVLLYATLLIFGWPGRIANVCCLPGGGTQGLSWLGETDELTVLRTAVPGLSSPACREAALQMLIEGRADVALPILLQTVKSEPDTTLRAAETRLIGLYRYFGTAPLLEELLLDREAEVRAAAADALGIIYCPAYSLPAAGADFAEEARLASPRIDVSGVIDSQAPYSKLAAANADDSIPMPKSRHDAMRKVMLEGASEIEREAAARSLLPWPPENYHLRYAEWGVWLARGADRENLMIKRNQDEIPLFVHHTGDPSNILARRIGVEIPLQMRWGMRVRGQRVGIITKPVVHLAADQAMVVDLQIDFRYGRPLYGYPWPDDISLLTTVGNSAAWRSSGRFPNMDDIALAVTAAGPPQTQRAVGFSFASLDDPQIRPLKESRAGYPWLLPNHRVYGTIGPVPLSLLTPPGQPVPKAQPIDGAGLHWQSLIVSPQRLPWMKTPEVGPNPKYQWWTRLRDVPCSWVDSRGEAERFVYYDGPTLMRAPLAVALDSSGGMRLRFQKIEEPFEILFDSPPPLPSPRKVREGLFIQVTSQDISGLRADLSNPPKQLPVPASLPLRDAAVRQEFLKMLIESGLNQPEAEGMAECWDSTFFATPGRRFLLFMTGADYDRFLPLTIRPKPTEIARVGIVLTELE